VDLTRSILEHDPIAELHAFLGEPSTTVADIVFALKAAAQDERVESLLLVVGQPSGLDMAKAGEIREAVARFRAAGKPASAYIEAAGTTGYYVASACDNVYLMPGGMLAVTGFLAEVPFFRATLDKVRIEPQFFGLYEYKSAADSYMREGMSDPDREQWNAILDGFWQELTAGIAASRKLDAAAVEAAIHAAPQMANEALQARLVDELLYWDMVKDRLGIAGDEEGDRVLDLADYVKSLPSGPWGVKHKIAVVYGIGAILDGESDPGLFGMPTLGSDTVSRAIRQAAEDDSIEAIVFRVDSPGGSATASDEIWREVFQAKTKKPVIVSMSYVAGSGGYWVSMCADKIVANPVTITGSIGVVGGKLNLGGLYDWAGVKWETLKRGARADLMTDTRPFSDEDAVEIQSMMGSIYEEFVRKVADGRRLPEEKVREIAKGRIWTGRQGKEIGLVDELGGLDAAVQLAKKELGIPEDEKVGIVAYPRAKTIWESFFGEDSVRILAGRAPGRLGKLLAGERLLEAWRREPVLALDPQLWLGL
jgi:protease-4